MPDTENIAILVLLLGYPALVLFIKIMWDDNKVLRNEAKNALREGIEIEKSRTAEITSISNVMSAVQRAVVSIEKLVQQGFEDNLKHNQAIYNRVRK